MPLFGGVRVSSLEEPDTDDLPKVKDENEEDDFFFQSQSKQTEQDLFTDLGPTKKTTRPRQAAELFLEDEAAEDMLSHKFDDLLVLKATSAKDEGIFRSRNKYPELFVPEEEDVRVPDLDMESLEAPQRRKRVNETTVKATATKITQNKNSASKKSSQPSIPTTLDNELFDLVGGNSSNSQAVPTEAAFSDISTYIAKQQQTTKKGLFDD